MKNKKVKQMICELHKQKGENVAFESKDNYGETGLIGWSLLIGDGYSEFVDYPVRYFNKVSLTANQLKGIKQ